jgi:serine/threonine protein kinase/tetratricopeptide (TPR) repeat protein
MNDPTWETSSLPGCLGEAMVLAFLDGKLSPAPRAAVEAHIASCIACADLTTWTAAGIARRSAVPGHEGRPLVGQLAPGTAVDRYQILGAIGRGAMGEVYAAYHPDLDRRIALKVVHGGSSGPQPAERWIRLLREARAIARLTHPNVVAVFDAGTVAESIYIAMEFVDGETVDEWLRSGKRGWREVLDVFVAAGRGLAAAHAAHIIHRDFKPNNVMVTRDGSVRVMDFGLARIAGEVVTDDEPAREAGGAVLRLPATVTKTGALVGTPAYMAPEQFRGGPIDARADQFSFCVALHEALFRHRPKLAHLQIAGASNDQATDSPKRVRHSGAPAWLRSVALRGLSPDREQRYPSMEALLRALTRGRGRGARQTVALSVTLAVALLAFGGWKLSRRGHISCGLPNDRLASAWSGKSDARRDTIHRTFLASGRPTAETSWQRVSQYLDDYIGKWSAMYMEACEATHVRGEQSAAVLDLRMSCLNENLDNVRALTDALSGPASRAGSVTGAIAATRDLTPVSRCGDLAALRSTVPPPRDQKTFDAVQRLRADLRDAEARCDLGDMRRCLTEATTLRQPAEQLGYRPLIAQILELIGRAQAEFLGPKAESTLKQAFIAAESAGDDEAAARVATDLTYVIGFYAGRFDEGDLWFDVGNAVLDRLGPGHERVRGWALTNRGAVLFLRGDLNGAMSLLRSAVALKETALGRDHPDIAMSLTSLGAALSELGRLDESLLVLNRAIDILDRNGDPESVATANALSNRGECLNLLGRFAEAETDLNRAAGIWPVTWIRTTFSWVRYYASSATPLLAKETNKRRGLCLRRRWRAGSTVGWTFRSRMPGSGWPEPSGRRASGGKHLLSRRRRVALTGPAVALTSSSS